MSVSFKRLLHVVSKVGTEFTIDDVASKLNLSLGTTRKYINEMIKHGLIIDLGKKYVASEKCLFLLEGLSLGKKSVEENISYIITNEKGNPIPLKIDSIEKLYIAIKYGFIPKDVLMYHIVRGYLSKWITESIGAKILAQRLLDIKSLEDLLELLEEYLDIR